MASSSSKKLTKYETRNFIPDDITTDILTRLSVKSLSRFKCVSKPWLSLISSEKFVKTHLLSNSPRVMLTSQGFLKQHLKHCSLTSLINSETITDEEAINIDFPKDIDQGNFLYVVGTCNGLVCFSSIRSHGLFLWNPCTGQFNQVLPASDTKMHEWFSRSHEFGYSAVDDDYKVLRLIIRREELEVDIYSWRANSWETRVWIDANISPHSELKYFAGKNMIHMITYAPGAGISRLIKDIESFDLENGVFGTIEQPDYGGGVEGLSLKELGGCFSVVCRKETQADLWVMKEYGVKDSWTKMLTVSFLPYSRKVDYMNPLIILPSGEILIAFKGCLEVYNLKDNSTRVLDIHDPVGEAYLYVESLVSPHEIMGYKKTSDA